MSVKSDKTKACVAAWAIVTCSVVIACFCFTMVKLENLEKASQRAEAAAMLSATTSTDLARALAGYLDQSNRILEGGR